MVCSSIVRTIASCLLAVFVGVLASAPPARAADAAAIPGPPLRFDADTFDFANQTVFLYPHGYAEKRRLQPGEQAPAFTLRCFAMCRAVEQFRKFARFDPALPPLDDGPLAARLRRIMHRAPWRNALPPERRVVVPGYANLRALSHAQPLVVQRSMGGGWWATYLRPGNYRMFSFWWNTPDEQARTQRNLEDVFAHHDLFIAYLTTYPSLSINHAVLLYGRRPADARGVIRYEVYDPNHPEAPREMLYDPSQRVFSYQKDWDFVGGKVIVLRVYGFWLQ